MTLGLSNSDVDYLNIHNNFNIPEQSGVENLLQENIVQIASEHHLQQGQIINQLQLTDIAPVALDSGTKTSDENHFVQVSGESALGLLIVHKEGENGQNYAMVSIPVSETNTVTTTTDAQLGFVQTFPVAQVSDSDTNPVQLLTLPHTVGNVIGDNTAVDQVQSQIHVMSGTNEPQIYVLSMTAEDDNVNAVAEEEKITPDKGLGQPQCTSTPMHALPVKPSLNETIIAGNIDAESTTDHGGKIEGAENKIEGKVNYNTNPENSQENKIKRCLKYTDSSKKRQIMMESIPENVGEVLYKAFPQTCTDTYCFLCV